ncbi:MAG TPA: hypothetical protein VGD43_22110 [Micromonospora sp.]
MAEAADQRPSDGREPSTAPAYPVRVVPRHGLNLLPFFPEPDPEPIPAPTTFGRASRHRTPPPHRPPRAWSPRRLAGASGWLVPGYAIVFGVATLGAGSTGSDHPVVSGDPLRLGGWVVATWLGILALASLTGLISPFRGRRTATAGLLAALAGTVLMLPFAPLPEQTDFYGFGARLLALTGAAGYSLGWVLAGAAVLRSRAFNPADGWTLVVAAPMGGVGGMLLGELRTVGALLVLAGGIGLAWRAARLPAPRADTVRSDRRATGRARGR